MQPLLTAPSFEQHPTGFGIGTATPRISWRFIPSPSTIQAWEQCAYDIEIVHLPGDRQESYHVVSTESMLVSWPSKPLQARGQARVRVRAHGRVTDGETERVLGPTPWSPWAVVECALLNVADWVARPITTTTAREPNGPQRPLYFRKCFKVPFAGKVSQARLYITSLGSYRSYINGCRVGDHCLAPGWTSYNNRLNYQIFDVASLINCRQENVIAVEVGEGWYATRLGFFGGTRCIYGNDLAVLAQVEIVTDQQETFALHSDSSWKCAPSAIIRSEIYDGELYDAREEQQGWNIHATFDDRTWQATRTLDMPGGRLVIPSSPPVRVTQVIAPTSIFSTESAKTIIDFGQNLVGKLRIRSLNKPAGSRIRFAHGEVLENVELCVRPLRDAKCTDEVITSGQKLRDWSPGYTFRGFRYVQVEGWSASDESEPLSMSSIERLVWSMRGNFLSIPTDCPQRDERLGWTGDIQVFCPSASFLYNTAGILGDWLKDLALEQFEADGVPPFVVPNALGEMWEGIPQAVWDDVTVLTPWDLYQYFGDREILRCQYQSMLAWIDTGIRRGPDGLWDPELWQLGD
ncbi:hypothetical protein Aspvir_002901 [Aspergillus viridinutans]|uniref:alpha-L-rhamnosidase n=1 Tax=Aspergillus viridinutans TaxID=75553 RepID=A0A9P3FA16_ASPVI|nr:uncharacterized protein Aspvir_002901 [Aspergillus viridinutans]GIK07243.1 hypothetical protein Aspvir_002901 [Aspergillus viridinutans]